MSEPNEVYAFLYRELTATQRARCEHEAKALELRRKETHIGGLLVLTRDLTCMHCHGEGKAWTLYAQDDTKLEPCTHCKGTGARHG